MNVRPVLAAACLIVWVSPVFGASDFYPFAQRWNKERAEIAADEVVGGSLSRADVRPADSGIPDPYSQPLPAIKRLLSSFAPSGSSVELERGQLLILASDSPISKFAAVDEGIVDVSTDDTSTLLIVSREVGRTVVHAWDASGRRSFEVRVIPRKITGPTYFDLKRDEIQKTRPFKVRLTSDAGTFERGEKYSQLERTSFDTSQAVVVEGDTPYGFTHAHAQVQRSGLSTKNILSDAQVALIDGKVGPVENFSAAVGDSQVKPEFLVFSRGRVRGVAGEKWTEDRRFNFSGFFGREQRGIFGPLSPTTTASKRTIDSFLSGQTVDYKQSDDLRMRAGYYTGYGKSRPDELNKQGMAWSAVAQANDYITLLPEIDYDTEHAAHLHAVQLKGEKVQARAEFRNVNEDFQSMIGAPASQGELGGRLEVQAQPWERWRWRGGLDVFKDRLIPNPENMGRYNVHADSEIAYDLADRSAVAFTWRDWDDTGRLSPTRERQFGLQYTESFEAFARTIAINLRGGHRQSRFLTQSQSDYDRQEITAGIFFPLFWDIRFSLQKEWNWLDDRNLAGRHSQPEAITYTLSYSHRLWDSPLYLDLDFRHRDEEETESPNSFMAGEDSSEIAAGLYYRETEDLELYLKGQFQSFNAESLNIDSDRAEGQVLAGMRWDWDTGIRWGGVGHVQGSVFKDDNRNSVRDTGESGLSGVAVETAGGPATVSDADGRFAIRNIMDRAVTIAVEPNKLPAGYVPTGSVLRETALKTGETVTIDFGFAPRSEITGVVFNDANGNGLLDAGETGVARVRVKMEGKTTFSGANGAYAFRGAEPGMHDVELDMGSLAEGYLPSNVSRKNLELAEGMRYEWNVPLRAYRVVSGRVFRDRDSNGAYSHPEDELAGGVTVRLGALSQRSDAQGRFLFDNLTPGKYELAVDASQIQDTEKIIVPAEIELGMEPKTVMGADIAIAPKVKKAPSFAPMARTASAEERSSEEPAVEPGLEGLTEPSS